MGNDFMASAAQSYAKEVRSQFERYATWLPNEIVVNVGDIGVLHKNIFYKEANVKQLGINLPTSSDPKAKAQYKFTSKGTAQVSGKASASGIPTSTGQISSTLEISFSDEHALYFQLEDCVGTTFANLVDLKTKILGLVAKNHWALEHVVVTRVIRASAATILQSSSKGASIVLEAKNSVPIAEAFKVAGGVSYHSEKSIGVSIVAEGDVTPLLTVGKVDYKFLDILKKRPQFRAFDSQRAGTRLFRLMLKERPELQKPGFFVEVGTDEELADYPWELAYDAHRNKFLCLEHYVGRYVNAKQLAESRMQPQIGPMEFEKMKFLLISVPRPDDPARFPALSYVESEAKAIKNLVERVDGIELRELVQGAGGNDEPTMDNVEQELMSDQYHFIHFCGHAIFDEQTASNSALILEGPTNHNRLTAELLLHYLGSSLVLAFINGCDSARNTPWEPEVDLDVGRKRWHEVFYPFGIARAFMERGSNLLGSRWKLSDKAAPIFAEEFYRQVFKEFRPFGEAITKARIACKNVSAPEDIGWASYVYYGDPRLALTDVGAVVSSLVRAA
jgi:CHAT domain-containing protein